MASKRHKRRRACESKRAYPTQEAALRVVYPMQRKEGARMNVYRCPFGKHFHIGRPKGYQMKVVE